LVEAWRGNSYMLSAKEITVKIVLELEKIGAEVINKYRLSQRHSQETGVDSYPHDEKFWTEPNSTDTIRKKYHYWGIVSHSIMAMLFLWETKEMVAGWGHMEKVKVRLKERVDNNTKTDLLRLALVLHDVGKFAVRYLQWRDGELIYRFQGHEKASGEVIRTDLRARLREWGLTEDEVEYVARLAEKHYELARVREDYEGQYDWDYVQSASATAKLGELRDEHLDIDIEIGLMFLADSLAKTKYHAVTPEAAQEIISSGIVDPPEHVAAVMTVPVNVDLAKKYFSLIK